MNRIAAILLILLMAIVVSACQTNPFAAVKNAMMTPEGSLFGGGRVNVASANQMMYEEFEGFTDRDLLLVLDSNADIGNWDTLTSAEKSKQLNKAYLEANKAGNEARRAQIQDRLIAASNQRCNLYATHLKKMSTNINGFLGTVTTAVAGAGAIVTGAEAARILAGIAGITSGTRAELNQAIFETVTTSVIIPAFQQKRADLATAMIQKRSRKISEYTIEGAIADAINYHGACSLDSGISQAQRSLQFFGDIGLTRMLAVQKQLDMSTNNGLIFAVTALENFVKDIESYKIKYKLKLDVSPELTAAVESLLTRSQEGENGDLYKKASELDSRLLLILKKPTDESDSKRNQQAGAAAFQELLDNEKKDILSKLES
ncbi:MAG: hypothetical protein LZF61_03045 [Nitrosomonas sp.]|nr:MAG: hypothetical protein LZF61_03045 [Nitrosomonas sp.]